MSTDFEGSQWSLFKYPPEDLRTLYGIEITELYVWRPVIEHLAIALRDGQLLTIEVDAYFLPDTAGVTYKHRPREDRDRPADARPCRDAGCGTSTTPATSSSPETTSTGSSSSGAAEPHVPLPYVEVVRLDRLRHPGSEELTSKVVELTREHLRSAACVEPDAQVPRPPAVGPALDR